MTRLRPSGGASPIRSPRLTRRTRALDFDTALERAKTGHEAGWSHLYDEVAPLVLGYLRGQRAPDPEDLLGEVMLQVVRDIDGFEGDRRSFRSWVLVIAHHRLLDDVRYRRRRPVDPAEPDALRTVATTDDPGQAAADADGLRRLLDRLDVLTDDQRTVLLLRVVADLDLEEVADILGRRTSAITSLQHRAVTRLRTALVEERRHAPAERPAHAARLRHDSA